jgi:membrane-associated protein
MNNTLYFLLHLDKKIGVVINEHGTGTYLILFAIIFAETGLVVTPILPGDSLLFAVGIFCHPGKSVLSVYLTFGVLMGAAFLGDTTNYFIGQFFGHRLFKREDSKIFKTSYLVTTHEFFEKHGRSTVILARFVPIVRTFAPFVAGMSDMPYRRFIGFSILGTALWVSLFLFGGYFLGALPIVSDHFGVAVILMVLVTAAPLVYEVWKTHRENEAKRREAASRS